MSTLITALLILWVGISDRVRGGFPDDSMSDSEGLIKFKNHVRHVVKFTPGAALGLLIGAPWQEVLAAAVLFKFGEQAAGNFGRTFRNLRQWNWANVKELIRTGFLWGVLPACIGIFGTWQWLLLPFTMVLASVLGGYMARHMPPLPRVILELDIPAAWQEFLRGYFTGLFFYMAGTAVL